MRNFILIFTFGLLFLYLSSVNAEDRILIYYYDRVPYAVTDAKGGVTGLCATPAEEAFTQAGIPFQWKKMPFKRQLQTIKFNKQMGCGIGWFKNPEREKFARFTDVLYQDQPAVTIGKKGNDALSQHKDLIRLLADRNLMLLVKDGFSYGAYIDDLIQKLAPQKLSVVGTSNVQMLQMILSGRADYYFISQEEAESIILKAGYEMSQFRLHRYADMPPGNRRYIACSMQVPAETVDLINRELKKANLENNRP